ncbi:MAG TPA: TRAP transporter substrate-binding protein [Firmicutes bacterium]|nr:TRAP transporter substrate-binding protein [Bacillota bacterium]
MKKLTIVALTCFLVLAVVLSGCSGKGPAGQDGSAGDKPVVLKLGHVNSDKDLWQDGSLKFAELVSQKTGGKVKVEVYPSSQLGNDRDMAEGLQMGSVDFALIAGVLGNFEPSIQLLEMPYLFRDDDHLRKVLYGPIGQEIFDKLLSSASIRGLTYWDRGPREVTSNKPINSPADLKGLKIRVPEIPPMVAAWKAMGANPTPMAFGEVYTALQQHTIDAQENPISIIYSARFNEVQKYLAMTNHKYEYVILAMSDKTYQKLTPDQQKAVEEAAKEAADYYNNLVTSKTDQMLKELKDKGMQVTTPNAEEFAKLAKTTHAEFADKYGKDIYDRIINTK